MKLPYPQLTLAEALSEFDIWITPSTGEIKDTERFRSELDRIVAVFDLLAKATTDFCDLSHCEPKAIAATVTNAMASLPQSETLILLESLAAVLFLVTGKSDNNGKCQLPLYLRDVAGWTEFPVIQRKKIVFKEIPRELKSDRYMKVVADLRSHKDQQERLLNEFCRFLLSTDDFVLQFWSVGRSYVVMKQLNREHALLTPLVVFQVRGSVSASGGHGPEEILRDRLTEWGMERGIDFNTTDAVINPGSVSQVRTKTRAYDFILPYRTPGWTNRIFVQCQFYAGDSGSVSHKNVDQTRASRDFVTPIHSEARYVEYLDGAGYFSSLNGDLKSLLSMQNTSSFFQIRSAPVRLRRELQVVGFLTPLEIEHAIFVAGSKYSNVEAYLLADGYAREEVKRAVESAKSRGVIDASSSDLAIADSRRAFARRMLLLDTICCFGETPEGTLAGYVFAPGYGGFHGMKMDDLIRKVISIAPVLKSDWTEPTASLEDLRWLAEQGYVMSR
jgi:hypothetical protein